MTDDKIFEVVIDDKTDTIKDEIWVLACSIPSAILKTKLDIHSGKLRKKNTGFGYTPKSEHKDYTISSIREVGTLDVK